MVSSFLPSSRFRAGFAAAALLSLVAGIARADDVDCDKQSKAIHEKFKDVFAKTPAKACDYNNNAGWDKTLSQQLDNPDKKTCTATPDGTVCQATYKRLQTAVTDYQKYMKDACQQGLSAKTCMAEHGDDQKAAFDCASKAQKAAADASAKARKALSDAVKEGASYKKLADAAQARYAADRDKMKAAREASIAAGEDPGTLETEMSHASLVKDNKFVSSTEGGGLLGKLSADVNADNGVKGSTISRYQDSVSHLIDEQAAASRTIDSFTKVANVEIKQRSLLETSLNLGAATNDKHASGSDSADSKGSSISGTGSSSNASNGMLSNAGGLASLATAGTGLAKATSGMSGSSSMPSSGAADNPSAPTAYPSSPEVPSQLPNVGATRFGDGAPPSTGGTTSPSAPIAPTVQDNSQFGVVAGHGGSGIPGSAPTASGSPIALDVGAPPPSPTASKSGASMAPSGDFAGIKPDRAPASAAKDAKDQGCAAADCSAMNDLKTTQFNAAGALGAPRIGAPDPALSTTGALDNLFGPLANVDAADKDKPTAPAKGGGLLDGMLGGFGVSPTDPEGAGATQASAAPMPSAETRSLFARVHDVHENAVKKGALSLFHRKL